MRSMFRFGVAVAAILFVVDQATKLYVHDLLAGEGAMVHPVLPFLNLVTVWNHGISFGLFNVAEGVVRWFFVALGGTVIVGLVAWLTRIEDRLIGFSLGLAIGGAAGNLADRVRFGAVFDFVDIHALGWHFWIFNAADAGISLGALALLVGGLLGHRPGLLGPARAGEPT
jgi:signal peptidase II